MKKILSLFAAFLFVGNIYATQYISYNMSVPAKPVQYAATTVASTSVATAGSVGEISWTGTSCTYSDNRVNIAANGSITFTASTGNVIKKIVIKSGSTATYYGTWTSSPEVTPSSSSGVTTFDGLSANSVTVTTSTDFRCTNASDIKIYYSAVGYDIVFDPNEISVDEAGDFNSIDVLYKDISDMDMVDIELFNDAEHTSAFTSGWLLAGWEDDNTKNSIEYMIDVNTGDARTAYMYISYLYEEDEDLKTFGRVIPVSQAKAEAASLPFSFDGGRDDIANKAGLSYKGLSGDYGSAPKLKFENANTELVLRINEAPGDLTFSIKGNTYTAGEFKIQTSTDGETYTDLATYTTEITGSTQNKKIENISSSVRYIKWIYTNKNKGNVALGNIALAKRTYPVTFNSSPSHGSLIIYEDDYSTLVKSGNEYTAGTELIVYATPSSGYNLDGVKVVKTSDPTDDVTSTVYNDGTGVLAMPEYAVTVSASFSPATALEDVETSVKAVKVLRDGVLFIEKDGKTYNAQGQLVK